jgi:hypothetical protein|tara:strand:+ start:1521 stop:2153 length:633 start_codon:yes stop_codon:yes gene_type:complete
MVWGFGKQPQQNTGFGVGYQPPAYQSHPQFAQPAPVAQPAMGAGMGGAFMGGATGGAYTGQPVTPPSELEIVAMLMNQQKPVDQFLMGPNLNMLISIIANIVNLSIVEFFRNAKFKEDDNGNLCVDITSLPTQYQTLSPENVTAEMTQMQSVCNQTVQKSIMDQQQILTQAQQSMMQGALDMAMNDPGIMEKAGQGAGAIVRGLAGFRQV